MHTLKRNNFFHLQALANLNNYLIIMIDIIIKSLINSLITFSYHHFYPFQSFFPTFYFFYPKGRDPKGNKHLSEPFLDYA